MAKYRVTWIEEMVCSAEIEADSVEDAILRADMGEVEDSEPQFLRVVTHENRTTAELAEEEEAA